MKIYRFKAIKNPVGDYGACELQRIMRMTTDNILTQYGNTPQVIGERYYFYATDEGRMPTIPSVNGHPNQLVALKLGWRTMKWERYFIQWEAVQEAKPALQIYQVVDSKNEPVNAVLFETLITKLISRYPGLKVLCHPPVGKK
jgi:hypothetical protein